MSKTMEAFEGYPHKIKRLLSYLSEQLEIKPEEIKTLYDDVRTVELVSRCQVRLVGEGAHAICLLKLNENGRCPYHGSSRYDHNRTCQYRDQRTRRQCYSYISGKDKRNLEVRYCKYHQQVVEYREDNSNGPQQFARIGNYIVLDGTVFVISDDMTSIIGYTELAPNGKIVLRTKYKEGMDECVRLYGLNLEFEEEK
jgi:hypothetical protein